MKSLHKALIVSAGLFLSSTAMATTEQYGTLLSGSYQPSVPFANLDVSGSGTTYQFTLATNDLNTIFAPGSFIGAIAVDVSSNILPTTVSYGDSPVSVSTGSGPTGAFEFRFDLTGPKQARLTSGESVSWTATFAQPVTFEGTQFALHVQGLSKEQGGSGWYTNSVSPVPEPETYGLMLSGLGLIGFITRRRKTS
ncbi:MAG TPA: FxDxF family PEP-CTERM protein [Methylotenera sp.]|nr:FxDxF family PEP-CTERM protein [Methylotenera sp.]